MFFFFQAEDGIRDSVASRGLGDVYKRQIITSATQEVRSVAPKIIAQSNFKVFISQKFFQFESMKTKTRAKNVNHWYIIFYFEFYFAYF